MSTDAPIAPTASGVAGEMVAASRDGSNLPTPAEELASFTAWATAIFYLAEADHNPAVETYFDAYHYIATSLSVGYANIFPVTQVGKMVGAVVMMVGPALSSRALDASSNASSNAAASAPAEKNPQADALIAKLDEILVELRRSNEGPKIM